jgi:hypothetical protein
LREIPRLRVKPGARLDPATVKTGYADMAIIEHQPAPGKAGTTTPKVCTTRSD